MRLVAVQRPVHAVAAASPSCILIVNDSEMVRRNFLEMLNHQGYEATSANCASDAAGLLAQRQFDLLLCDIAMLEQNGFASLTEISQVYPDMAVILTTGHRSERPASEVQFAELCDVISIPCNQGELASVVQRNLTRRALQRKHAERFRLAFETSHESVLDALLTALNTRDTETHGHSERVTAYTMEISDRLEIPSSQRRHIERGALLHDIGKIGIPDRILQKAEKLTAEEWTEMRGHPVVGYEMCAKIDLLRQPAQVVLHHHEKWDGSGYPAGLRAEAIPIGARIFAVADALDAMTSDRPYRTMMSFTAARQEILKCTGQQFDPTIVKVFLGIAETRLSHIRSNAAR